MPHHDELNLSISRLLRATRAQIWEAWSKPDHFKHWWCPSPWVTEVLEFDFRAGGGFHTRMRGPEGGESDNPGSFLEIEPMTRIVFSSLLLADWRPAPAPWMPMTAIITLSDEPGGTRYSAHVMHASAESCAQHAQMGFEEGWGLCIQQLDDYAFRGC